MPQSVPLYCTYPVVEFLYQIKAGGFMKVHTPLLYPPQRRFFLIPNAIFELDLSAGEIAVYAYLIRCENRSDYTCFPSFRKIGSACKLSRNTIMKHVHALESKGLIQAEQTQILRKGKRQNGNLRYTILPISYAKELYNERLMAQNEKVFARLEAAKKLKDAE